MAAVCRTCVHKESSVISGLGMLSESLVLCLPGVVGKFTLKAGSLLGTEQLLIVQGS